MDQRKLGALLVFELRLYLQPSVMAVCGGIIFLFRTDYQNQPVSTEP